MHLEKGSAAILDLSAADWATQSQVQGAVRLELDLVDEQDGDFRQPELLHLEGSDSQSCSTWRVLHLDQNVSSESC